MRHPFRRICLLALAGLLVSAAQESTARPAHSRRPAPYIVDTSRPFNQYTWITAHNAFSNGSDYRFWYQNQSHSVGEQLQAGVRGLMLDIYESNGAVRVCHSSCGGIEKRLSSYLSEDILPFLSSHKGAVITVFLEDYVSQASLQAELARVPELAGKTFSPDSWPASQDWPTLRDMREANQRLLIFALNGAAGTYRVGSGDVEVMRQESGTVENYWSLGNTVGQHDFSCTSRFAGGLDKSRVDWAGKAWRPLMVMNQFHGVGEYLHARLDNRYDWLQDRFYKHCGPAARGGTVNFVAVDFYQQGDTLEFAGILSTGGLVLYEGNNVTQDVVCGIPGAPTRILNFPVNGCENDEARSGRLHNVKAGTVFRLYDSPSGSTSDDYTELTIKRDIGRLDIGSFERNVDNADYKMVFRRKNGLDGKISRVQVLSP